MQILWHVLHHPSRCYFSWKNHFYPLASPLAPRYIELQRLNQPEFWWRRISFDSYRLHSLSVNKPVPQPMVLSLFVLRLLNCHNWADVAHVSPLNCRFSVWFEHWMAWTHACLQTNGIHWIFRLICIDRLPTKIAMGCHQVRKNEFEWILKGEIRESKQKIIFRFTWSTAPFADGMPFVFAQAGKFQLAMWLSE